MATLATTTTDFAYAAQTSPAQQSDPNTSPGKHGPSVAISAAIIAVAALVTLTLITLIIYLSYRRRRRRASLNSAESRSSDKTNTVDLEKCISTPTAPLPALAFKKSDKCTSGRTSHPQPRLVAHCQPPGTRHTPSFSQVPPASAAIKSGDQIRAGFAKLIKSSRLDLSAAFSSIPLAAPRENSCIMQEACKLKPPPAAQLSPNLYKGQV